MRALLKTLGVIVGLVVVAVAGLLLYATTKPDVFRIERSVVINAPPEKIFPLITDLRQWPAWSPYEKKDPAMKRSYGVVTRGRGAIYEWDGDGNVGSGKIIITESAQPSLVRLDLDMIRPFAAHNIVEFRLEPQGDATKVSWMMNGAIPYPAKVVHVLFDMDQMVGKDFVDGLASLKAAAEK
jgi:uncharacterized protein YndB with AHSA1/START domain